MKFKLGILLLLFSYWVAGFAAEQAEWELQRDRDGIQVYTRAVEGSPYDAVRSTTVVQNVRLSALVAVIEDFEACPDWADRCAESYLVERISNNQALVYTHNDMPFPVKDRDVLARIVWHQDPDSFEVLMDSVATSDLMDEVRGRLRLTEAVATWRFTPVTSGTVEITSEAHIDPGSSLPGWVTNMLLVDTPFVTMKELVAEVVKPKYRDAQISFIMEPTP